MLYDPLDGTGAADTETEIVREAIERWKDISEWQGTSDERARQDIKFSHGDARNAWQWPDKIYAQRTGGDYDLPALTINKTRVHNDIVINEMSKGGFGLKIRPTGGKASAKSAEVMMSLVRRIQNVSRYQTHRRRVAEHQVDGGVGYMVLETRYTSNRSRNQDIYLSAPRDPTAVFLDRWIKEPDGSDANFGFLFERMPRREFNRKFPQWVGKVGHSALTKEFVATWLTDREIILARYYRKVQKRDRYIWYRDENGVDVEKLESEIKADTRGEETGLEIYRELMRQIREGDIDGGTRRVFDDQVEWYLIAGDTIIDSGDWPGKYIPICRAVGREIVIENELDRKGHTRALIDAQRMLNYAASCSVESVAMQTRAQWLAPARAIDMEGPWKDSNIKNYTVLPYNDIDDVAAEGLQQVAPPQRLDPPRPAPGWLQVGQDAERHMMMASGQFQSQLGQPDGGQTAISGKAIGQRQEQADTATYHYTEHLSDMDRHVGTQLLDLIPKVYDTKRTLQVLDAKGELYWIMIDPDQQEALGDLGKLRQQGEAVQLALNPSVGEYECVSDPGPSWATQREEAWDAISMILVQAKELVGVVGDLLFKNADFPGAEELQDRMKREIRANKPYLFEAGIDPQTQLLQQQLQMATATNADLMGQLADQKLQSRGRDEKRDIDAFRAETERMRAIVEAIAKVALTPQQRAQMEHDIAMQSREHVFGLVEETNKANLDRSMNGGGNAS